VTQPEYKGARGSNAGDDFHELWALRQALRLLRPRTKLALVTVEGLRAEDEHGEPTGTWDGVDCTYYFEGRDTSSAKQIVVSKLISMRSEIPAFRNSLHIGTINGMSVS
jgi:hypothetical protein